VRNSKVQVLVSTSVIHAQGCLTDLKCRLSLSQIMYRLNSLWENQEGNGMPLVVDQWMFIYCVSGVGGAGGSALPK
jgi:hypothetical protein